MKKYIISVGALTCVIILFFLFTTVVSEGQTATLMSFGKPLKVIQEPGLYFRLPYPLHSVMKIDCRLTVMEPRPAEFLTADKKNLILESAICYNITDPILFLKTVRDKNGLEMRLTDLMSSHTGALLGGRELSDIINTDSTKHHFRQLNDDLSSAMKHEAQGLGIEVHTALIKRIMLPNQNKLAVYDRMRAERERIARKYLAEGEEQALQIRADADKTARTITAQARKEASLITGKADAEALRIYGEAYKQNPDFYRFKRAMEAYEKMFNSETVIVLDENSPILKELFSAGKIGE